MGVSRFLDTPTQEPAVLNCPTGSDPTDYPADVLLYCVVLCCIVCCYVWFHYRRKVM